MHYDFLHWHHRCGSGMPQKINIEFPDNFLIKSAFLSTVSWIFNWISNCFPNFLFFFYFYALRNQTVTFPNNFKISGFVQFFFYDWRSNFLIIQVFLDCCTLQPCGYCNRFRPLEIDSSTMQATVIIIRRNRHINKIFVCLNINRYQKGPYKSEIVNFRWIGVRSTVNRYI